MLQQSHDLLVHRKCVQWLLSSAIFVPPKETKLGDRPDVHGTCYVSISIDRHIVLDMNLFIYLSISIYIHVYRAEKGLALEILRKYNIHMYLTKNHFSILSHGSMLIHKFGILSFWKIRPVLTFCFLNICINIHASIVRYHLEMYTIECLAKRKTFVKHFWLVKNIACFSTIQWKYANGCFFYQSNEHHKRTWVSVNLCIYISIDTMPLSTNKIACFATFRMSIFI